MNVFATGPDGIRARFHRRALENFVIIYGLFLVVVTVVTLLLRSFGLGILPLLIADGVAIGVAAYAFPRLGTRRIGFRCVHCRKYIESSTPWICGFCNAKNLDVDAFPFANRCEHCKAEPKAYKCHHADCGELNFLSADLLESNYAVCINAPPVTRDCKRADKIREDREAREDLEAAVLKAELDFKLKAAKEKAEGAKIKPAKERLKEKLDEFYAATVGASDVAAEKIAEIDADATLPKEEKDRRKEAVLNWRRSAIN